MLGHSLGARVAYYMMRTLASNLTTFSNFRFENVYLLGGAVRRDSSKDWEQVTLAVRGNIVNVHNKDDTILSTFFRLAELRQNPCGRKPIKKEHPKIINVDARRIISNESHSAYRKFLSETIALWFHR